MKNKIKNTTRRSFIQGATAGTALAAAGISGFPHVVRAAAPVKVGVIHPVTGWAQYSGSQCRFGALAAIEEVNASGGIKSLGCLLYTSPSPRDSDSSRMPSSA